MNKTIVIYHGSCRDGFCAAWVYNKYRNERLHSSDLEEESSIEYFPGFYGPEPPDCKGRDVVIVDFCYELDQMVQIIHDSKSLVWLDHHKTAEPVYIHLLSNNYPNVRFRFDNNKSGAGLTWDYFFQSQPRPWLVDYVEDRDLWLHKLDRSEIVNAYIACLKFDFNVWDKVSTNTTPPFEYGSVAKMKTEQYVAEVCKNVYFANIFEPMTEAEMSYADMPTEANWKHIPTVNICQVDCSEVLHELCKLYPESPFSLYWFKRADGLYQYGLRSIGDFDVSTVAKLFGGGGHKNAAGFQLPYLLEELK